MVQEILSLQAEAKALSAATVAGDAGGQEPFEIATTLPLSVITAKITH